MANKRVQATIDSASDQYRELQKSTEKVINNIKSGLFVKPHRQIFFLKLLFSADAQICTFRVEWMQSFNLTLQHFWMSASDYRDVLRYCLDLTMSAL